MANVLMYSTNNTACRSAPLCPAPQFLVVPEQQPSHYRLQALAEVLVTSDSHRRLNLLKGAGDWINSAGNWVVTADKDVTKWFEDASDSVVGWFKQLGEDIQCVRAPSNPRGSPR